MNAREAMEALLEGKILTAYGTVDYRLNDAGIIEQSGHTAPVWTEYPTFMNHNPKISPKSIDINGSKYQIVDCSYYISDPVKGSFMDEIECELESDNGEIFKLSAEGTAAKSLLNMIKDVYKVKE